MKRQSKRILSILLATLMIFTIVPMGALSASAIAPASAISVGTFSQTKMVRSACITPETYASLPQFLIYILAPYMLVSTQIDMVIRLIKLSRGDV